MGLEALGLKVYRDRIMMQAQDLQHLQIHLFS